MIGQRPYREIRIKLYKELSNKISAPVHSKTSWDIDDESLAVVRNFVREVITDAR